MEKAKGTIKFSVVLPEATYNILKKYAITQNKSVSTIVRGYIESGLKISEIDDNSEAVRRMFRDEIDTVFAKYMDRLIKIELKSAKASAITMYTALKIFAETTADDNDFERILAQASRKAIAYIRNKEQNEVEIKKEVAKLIDDINYIYNTNEG